jgi:hypothetical protein
LLIRPKWAESLPDSQLSLAEIMLTIEGLPADVRATYQALSEIIKCQK